MQSARIVLCLGLLTLAAGCFSEAPLTSSPESATSAASSATEPSPPTSVATHEDVIKLFDSLKPLPPTLAVAGKQPQIQPETGRGSPDLPAEKNPKPAAPAAAPASEQPPGPVSVEEERRTQALAVELRSALLAEDYSRMELAIDAPSVGFRRRNEALTRSLGEESVTKLRMATEGGNHAAENILGILCEEGIGVVKDRAEAFKLFGRAAEEGFAAAQRNLGHAYSNGEGVAKDKVEAAKWYRKAADQGDAAAQVDLALAYGAGDGVPQDRAESFRLALKAAGQGEPLGQALVALDFTLGDGVPQNDLAAQFWGGIAKANEAKDDALAFKWFRKAADSGDATVEFNLAYMYENGDGVAQNEAEAAKWYRKAAEQGLAEAQFNLALCYSLGSGVLKSPSAALEWYNRAANSYLVQKRREDALTCYDRMKGIGPEDPLTRALYGKLYAGQGAATDGEGAGSVAGTGWPVAGGYVVTCYHVVHGASKVTLRRSDGVQTSATVVLQDVANDLALLRPADATFLPAALPLSTAGPRVGQSVFAVGYPHPDIMGTAPKTTDGIVNSALGFGDDPRTFQISAALQAGNSGGPVFDMSGQVVGVALAKLNAVEVFKWSGDLPENVAYAVKVPYLQALLRAAPQGEGKGEILKPMDGATLDQVAAHVQGSVLLVIAEQ